ncbi:hypothetical protein AB0D12_37735 [Streptomyces sp. NPDC048479]|uniref:hypothetical protein n=1 Tax=Streptomyces sp. NPDC048479 TaxID=3154725 RepID=UPI00342E89A7
MSARGGPLRYPAWQIERREMRVPSQAPFRQDHLFLLNNGNTYDALACLFGIRNYFGFSPLAEGRGFPSDASEALRTEYAAYGGLPDVHGTTWITWSELAAADWQGTDSSGTRRRDSVAGDETHWGPVRSVMRTLSERHGADRS